MSVRILIDSTTDITPDLREKLTIVPLNIRFGNEDFVDGVTISHRQFYEKLIESDALPTTSQPAPDAFAQAFRRLTEAGETVVAITVSSKLSGTCQSARIAAQDFPGKVYVVDSQSVAIGTSILAQLALTLAEAGEDAASIVRKLEKERSNIRLLAMLDTLEYLKRGGRISKTAAFAGSLLAIKPVITLRDGEIVIVGKARGSRQGNNLLVQEILNAGGVDFSKPVMLGYTGLSDLLLRKYVNDSAALWQDHMAELPAAMIGSVVGTHAGPGAVAVAFFSANN